MHLFNQIGRRSCTIVTASALAAAAGLISTAKAEIPPELRSLVRAESPLATARVIGELQSPDGERGAIGVIAPANSKVEFGLESPGLANEMAFGSPVQLPIGTDPEGDVPADVEYAPDGNSYYILNRQTANVFQFDATSNAVIRTYALSGQFPIAMDITPDGTRMVIAYYTEDTAAVLDLSSGSEVLVAVGNGPGTVDITPDGTRALVGCVQESTVDVIDLATNTLERFIASPSFTQSLSFGLESGVVDLRFPSPVNFLDNTRIVFPGRFNSLVAVIDVATGSRTDIPTTPSPAGVAISADKSVIAVSHAEANGVTTIINPVTLTVTRVINSPGSNTRANGPIVLNANGTRAVIAFQNAARWLNLTTDTFSAALNTANLEDLTLDRTGTRAVGIGFSGAVIDLATGALLGRANDIVSATRGAASPTADRAVLLSWPTFGDDRVVIETDATPTRVLFDRTGPLPEGDVSRNGNVSPDGSIVVSSNLYSDNVTIFTDEGTLLGYAPLDSRPGEIEIAPNNTTAVGVNLDGFTVSVVNLATQTTTPVPSVTRLSQVEIDPAGQFAYVAQIASGDGVRKLNLSTNSFVGGLTATGDMGGVGYLYSQNSQIELSPDGTLLAVAGGFNDRLDIVNTSTMTVQQTFTGFGTFITRLAWSPEGDEILVSDRDSDQVLVVRRPTPSDPFALVGSIVTRDQPYEIVVMPNSDRAFVLNFGSTSSAPGSVGVLNTSTLLMETFINLPFIPAGLSLSPDSTKLAALSVRESTTVGSGDYTRVVDGELTIINTDTLAIEQTVDINQTGSLLAADPNWKTFAVPGMSSEVITVVKGPCAAEVDGNPGVDFGDFLAFFNCFDQLLPCGDVDGVPGVDFGDFLAFFNAFDGGC